MSPPAKRLFVFTSAGSRHVIDRRRSPGPRDRWDLIVEYYGDDDRECAWLAGPSPRAFPNKAYKFQNRKHAWTLEPTLLDGYDYVWVCDYDLIMKQSPAWIENEKRFDARKDRYKPGVAFEEGLTTLRASCLRWELEDAFGLDQSEQDKIVRLCVSMPGTEG